ncbi:MAG: hypothetical protein C0432_00840 [Candidatus Puniceispirillum sp.]|nr:hypothetical protein [Candidatus Pelagibacter sp.]MBA4282828.1 hypothetical protein [Candidatus Puniceispirillum sp.]
MLKFLLTFLYMYIFENVEICALQFSLDSDIKIEIGVDETQPLLKHHKRIVIKWNMSPGWSVASLDQNKVENHDFTPKPIELKWVLPIGFKIIKTQWSPSQTIDKYGYLYRGYTSEFYTMYQIETNKNKNLKDRKVLKFKVSVPLCKDFCKVVEKDIEFDISNLKKIDFLKLDNNIENPPLTIKNYTTKEIVFFILSAFLGGLLLNAMPCVFPVLSLKIFDLIHLSQNLKDASNLWHVKKTCLFFISGVIFSFLTLGILQYSLNVLGYWVGWGFQLQSPGFVFFLSILFFIMSLNFFGVFEIGLTLSSRMVKQSTLDSHFSSCQEYVKNFYNGMLLCLVATPCTAPFMGAALGATLSLPLIVSLLIYVMLALGLTSPFIAFIFFPRFLVFIPKPGQWMEQLKKIMGFAVLGSSLWLLWILLRTRVEFIFLTFTVFWALSCLLFLMGEFGHLNRSDKVRRFSSFVGWGIIASLVIYSVYHIENLKMDSLQNYTKQEIRKYEPIYIEQLKNEKKSFFINVTADWCITCQWNKKFVLHSQQFKELLQKKNIQYAEADWSRHDSDVTKFLNQHDSNSIPFLLYYNGSTGKTSSWSGIISYNDIERKLLQ